MSSPRCKMHHFILIFGFVLLPKGQSSCLFLSLFFFNFICFRGVLFSFLIACQLMENRWFFFKLLYLIWFLYIPSVATLKCYECLGLEACNIVKECPASNTHCGVLRITSYKGKSIHASWDVLFFRWKLCLNSALMQFYVYNNTDTHCSWYLRNFLKYNRRCNL